MTHKPGTILYLRLEVVSVDDRQPWGDRLVCKPVGRDGRPDEDGGIYAVNPDHTVTGAEVVKAVKKRLGS